MLEKQNRKKSDGPCQKEKKPKFTQCNKSKNEYIPITITILSYLTFSHSHSILAFHLFYVAANTSMR